MEYIKYMIYIYMYTLYLNLGGAKVDDCGEKYWKGVADRFVFVVMNE